MLRRLGRGVNRTCRPRGGDDLVDARKVCVLERAAERDRSERRADATDRRVQVVEGRGLHLRRDLGAEAAVLDRLVRNDEPAGAPDGLHDRSRSSGTSVRGSITSASMPSSAASRSAAASASCDEAREGDDGDVAAFAEDAASPIGTGTTGSGTSPVRKYSVLFSMNTTGFGSAIALTRSPAASIGRLGITTLRPGTCVSQLSRLCECCAAPR